EIRAVAEVLTEAVVVVDPGGHLARVSGRAPDAPVASAAEDEVILRQAVAVSGLADERAHGVGQAAVRTGAARRGDAVVAGREAERRAGHAQALARLEAVRHAVAVAVAEVPRDREVARSAG